MFEPVGKAPKWYFIKKIAFNLDEKFNSFSAFLHKMGLFYRLVRLNNNNGGWYDCQRFGEKNLTTQTV